MESVGKEREELSLPLGTPATLAGTSNTSNNVGSNDNNLEISGHSTTSCTYRAEVIKFKKTMVLPGNKHFDAS